MCTCSMCMCIACLCSIHTCLSLNVWCVYVCLVLLGRASRPPVVPNGNRSIHCWLTDWPQISRCLWIWYHTYMCMYSNWSTHICLLAYPGHKAFYSVGTLSFYIPVHAGISNARIFMACTVERIYSCSIRTTLLCFQHIQVTKHLLTDEKRAGETTRRPLGAKAAILCTPLRENTSHVLRDKRNKERTIHRHNKGTSNGIYSTRKRSLRLTCVQWRWQRRQLAPGMASLLAPLTLALTHYGMLPEVHLRSIAQCAQCA